MKPTITGVPIASAKHWSNPHPSNEFTRGIGDHLFALLDAGLQIELFKEYPYSNGWKPFPQLVEREGRRMTPADGGQMIPLMFGIRARKPLK